MSESESDIKRWTTKRKTQVVLDILKSKATVAEIARQHDLTPAEKLSVGAMRASAARRTGIREQYERMREEAHAALGEKELKLKARKKWQRLLDEDENS